MRDVLRILFDKADTYTKHAVLDVTQVSICPGGRFSDPYLDLTLIPGNTDVFWVTSRRKGLFSRKAFPVTVFCGNFNYRMIISSGYEPIDTGFRDAERKSNSKAF